MELRSIIGFFLVPLGLLGAAWLVCSQAFWSPAGNVMFPWLCTTLATSFLLVAGTCLVLQASPRELPMASMLLVYLGAVIVFACGNTKFARAAEGVPYAESIGFAVILLVVFLAPRVPPENSSP